MDVRLAALDVVVQVVPEQVDQVDGVLPAGVGGVAREEDERDVADVVAHGRLGLVLQLGGRVAVAVEDLGAGLVPAAGFFELLFDLLR